MKITKDNYFKHIERIGFNKLPEALKQAHLVIMTKTDNGRDWDRFESDTEFKNVRDLAFEKLAEFILHSGKLNGISKEYDPLKEIHFIERFLAFHDKRIYKNTIQIFINDLQKAILEKKIRKHSPYAKLIIRIQNIAIGFYKKANNVNHLLLSKELLNSLNKAILDYENKISKPEKNDPINPVELSGVENKEEKPEETKVLCSTDFTQLEFKGIGFTEKWLDFIGDPSPGFTAMVFGKPKMGKSYLCVDFAGYLARNFGKVLYVAKEEKLDATLQKKLKDKDVSNENLFVADHLPEDLSAYDFIFLDSVNLLGLSPEDLRKLKSNNPGKGFVYVFQTTKAGNFRGANSFQHDVDVVIEVPEKGKAIQFGRFNQGGEMTIFEDAIPQASEELSGTKKKVAKEKDWTEPKWLNQADWRSLKIIKRYCDQGKYKEAMNHAMDCDTVIREEIPGDIWKKMGGQLTKTGEEKLKAKKLKAVPEKAENKKSGIVFTYGVRLLKGLYENYSERKLTDAEYIELLEIAERRNRNFEKVISEAHKNLMEFLATMNEAVKEWDEKK